MTTLGELFPGLYPADTASTAVAGLTADSRKVQPGFVFVAVPGTKVDGLAFAAQAAAAGAVAVIGEGDRPADLARGVAYARSDDARRVLAQAAARLHPRQPETIVAVTGTAGKSSVADFCRQIFAGLGYRAASVGTIGVVTPTGARYGSLTTPDPVTLHETLQALADEGITHLSMEASSHGLDQRRLDGVRLTAAGYTNLGRDHLDYHPTMRDYLRAKQRLFDSLLPDGAPAVINADCDYAGEFIAAVEVRALPLMTVGLAGDDLHLDRVTREGFDQLLRIVADGDVHEVRLPLVGAFQAANALVAAGLCIATGEDSARVIAQLPKLTGVSGRLERVAAFRGGLCIVDYAHKPDALAHVLEAVRPFVGGRLICVFGCGGDRDPGKRPIMGGIAAAKADIVIVTDDNPRSEDPAAIRAAILTAAPDAIEIGDRLDAIRTAVGMMRAGDVLVVAGKGHETGQIVGDKVLPFSDHDAIRSAIEDLNG